MLEQVQPKDRVAIFHQVIVQNMTLARQMLKNSADCYLDDLYDAIKKARKDNLDSVKNLANELNLTNYKTEEGANIVDTAVNAKDITFLTDIGFQVVSFAQEKAKSVASKLKDDFKDPLQTYQDPQNETQHFLVLDQQLLAQVRDKKTPISDGVKHDIIKQAESNKTEPKPTTPLPAPPAYTLRFDTTVVPGQGR